MQLQTVVAMVAPAGHGDVFEGAAKGLPGVTFRTVFYESEDVIRDRVQELLTTERVDAIFLGPMPYTRCRDVLPPDLSVGVLGFGSLDLTLAYSRAFQLGWAPTPVSIDTFETAVVAEVSQALHLPEADIACLPYDADQPVDEIVAFHRDVLARAGGGYVITGRSEVAKRLEGQVPMVRSGALPATVRSALRELVLRVQSKRHSELRFAAGVFTVMAGESSGHLDRARVALMHTLLNTPELADAWIEDRGRRGVLLFAHKALLDGATGGWEAIPLIATAEARLGFRIAAGFGLGASARTCVLMAEQAVSRAERDGGGCAYLVSDDGLVIGPMGNEARRLEYSYREHEAWLEGLAHQVGLSPATLSRLAAVERKLAGRPFSPAELADALGITDPSGRRLLRTLRTHGLAAVVGSAQNSGKGRPLSLYRLHLDRTDPAEPDSNEGSQSWTTAVPAPPVDEQASAAPAPPGGSSSS